MTALWGAGHIYADVTMILNETLRQPGMELGVNPTSLKGDPVAGTVKELITVFDWNGIRYVMVLPEEAHFGFAVLRDFVRARSIAPEAGPAQTSSDPGRRVGKWVPRRSLSVPRPRTTVRSANWRCQPVRHPTILSSRSERPDYSMGRRYVRSSHCVCRQMRWIE